MAHSEEKPGVCCTRHFMCFVLSEGLLGWKWRESYYTARNQQRKKDIENKFVKLVCYINLQI